jgi:hypothetical protein
VTRPRMGDHIKGETQARGEFVFGVITEVRPDGSVLADIIDGPDDLVGIPSEFDPGEFEPAPTPPRSEQT